jgi:hypothetical protein
MYHFLMSQSLKGSDLIDGGKNTDAALSGLSIGVGRSPKSAILPYASEENATGVTISLNPAELTLLVSDAILRKPFSWQISIEAAESGRFVRLDGSIWFGWDQFKARGLADLCMQQHYFFSLVVATRYFRDWLSQKEHRLRV